jgi:predicted nucleic acid-binding protein
MTVFVDTGVLFALEVAESSRHASAKAAMESVLSGTYGRPVTSDYVVDEGTTLVRSRTGDFQTARGLIDRVLGRGDYPAVFSLRQVDPPLFRSAIETFEQYPDHSLSFTDATTISIVQDGDVDAVLAFDDDFDGLVDRLDPHDVA